MAIDDAVALWNENAGEVYNAIEYRRLHASQTHGREGVWGIGELAASEKSGTPDMSVDVAAGACTILGTEAADQGSYYAFNDDVVNVELSASDPSDPRIDLIVVQVRDDAYGGGTDDCRVRAVEGTPASSPSAPAIPDNTLVLAEVLVAASASSILDADITDVRADVRPYSVCTSSTRPTAPFPGQQIFETDTGLIMVADANGAWSSVRTSDTEVIRCTPVQDVTAGTLTNVNVSLINVTVPVWATALAVRFESAPWVVTEVGTYQFRVRYEGSSNVNGDATARTWSHLLAREPLVVIEEDFDVSADQGAAVGLRLQGARLTGGGAVRWLSNDPPGWYTLTWRA